MSSLLRSSWSTLLCRPYSYYSTSPSGTGCGFSFAAPRNDAWYSCRNTKHGSRGYLNDSDGVTRMGGSFGPESVGSLATGADLDPLLMNWGPPVRGTILERDIFRLAPSLLTSGTREFGEEIYSEIHFKKGIYNNIKRYTLTLAEGRSTVLGIGRYLCGELAAKKALVMRSSSLDLQGNPCNHVCLRLLCFSQPLYFFLDGEMRKGNGPSDPSSSCLWLVNWCWTTSSALVF